MTYVVGVLAALFSFGFIVFIHEGGHFLTARWAGIRCPQFAIGFGPKMFAFPWKGTEFSLRLFPLGGYVLMVGEDPGAEEGESWHSQFAISVGELSFPTTPASVLANIAVPDPEVEAFLQSLPPDRVYHKMGDLEGNFNQKTTFQKTVVILGGVFMNYVCATLLLLGLGFTVGLGNVQDERLARAQEVTANSPAARAGLKPGDNMIKVDGVSVVSGQDFIAQMSGKVGKTVTVTVRNRKGETRDMPITPDLSMGERFYFSQNSGQVQMVRVDEEVTLPKGITLPYQVAQVDGQPLKDLLELRGLGKKAKELKLSGPQGEWKLESDPNFGPRAIVGVKLAGVTSFGFEKTATADVISVTPGSQAERVGIKAGDELYSLQGVQVAFGQSQLEACLLNLSKRSPEPGESFRVSVVRDGKLKELVMEEIPKPTAEEWGVRLKPIDAKVIVSSTAWVMFKIVSVPYEIGRGLWTNARQTVKTLGKDSTGPIGIMQQIFEVSDEGLPELLFFVAILNAFIATFNLLPIPALDGSRCFFIWWGGLRGRAIDPEKEARVHFIGIMLLLSVVLLVSIQDVSRLVAGNHLMK